VRGGEGQNTVGLTVERDREIVAWHSANHTDRPKADAWREMHTALMQNLPLMDRYFVIESGAAICRHGRDRLVYHAVSCMAPADAGGVCFCG
jgi:hypothetical protein